MVAEVTACAYCGKAPGRTTDHLIKRAAARRRVEAARERENARYKVKCCHPCNVAIYTLCRVPESHVHLIPELEALTACAYRTWNGDPRTL